MPYSGRPTRHGAAGASEPGPSGLPGRDAPVPTSQEAAGAAAGLKVIATPFMQ